MRAWLEAILARENSVLDPDDAEDLARVICAEMPIERLAEIGKELLEWETTVGGWEAPCWTDLRRTIEKVREKEREFAE
jgi:hypothetical protein